MQIVRSTAELNDAVESLRAEGRSLGLVPTMGALHGGHLALIAEASRRCDRVAASIFVNPLQFAEGEDLSTYPRREREDCDALRDSGCDLVWIPQAEALYPDGFATTIHVAGLSDRWEGEARPGHFDGVATVVVKLLIAVRPDVAIFGEKDFQQLAIVRRLVRDLGLAVEIVGHPTIRESDGLAMSSRNAYLDPDERQRAAALSRSLAEAGQAILSGMTVDRALDDAKAKLRAAGFGPIDYVALVDPDTLEPVERADEGLRLIAAARLGRTRLIDTMALAETAGGSGTKRR